MDGPMIAPETILGPIFPETESFAVERNAAREALVEFKDPAGAVLGIDAAAGIEAAARKLFLFALAITILLTPVILYVFPKKLIWLKYTMLGVLGIVLVLAAYVWWVASADLAAFVDAGKQVEKEALEIEADSADAATPV